MCNIKINRRQLKQSHGPDAGNFVGADDKVLVEGNANTSERIGDRATHFNVRL